MEKIGMENIGMEKELKISSFSVEGKKATLYQPLGSVVEKNLAQPKADLEFDMERKTMESEGKKEKKSAPLLILHCFSEEEEAVVKL